MRLALAPLIVIALVASAGGADAPDALVVDAAVQRGLDALVRLQAEDGSFGEEPGVTALAGLAQGADGAWTGPDADQPAAYDTAMALLVLQVEKQYLPAFQR